MVGKTFKTYMTAVFELKSPTKTKIAVLNNRFLNYHIMFNEMLEDAKSSGLDLFTNQKTTQINQYLTKRLKENSEFVNKQNHRHLSLGIMNGLVEDLAATIQSYCELKNNYDTAMADKNIPADKKEKLSAPGTPTIPPLIPVQADWESRLLHMSQAITLDEETDARNRLLSESKAGKHRPIFFPRHRLNDGFLMLQHKTKSSFYILFNLHKKESRFSRKVDLSPYKVLATGKSHKSTTTGLVFPINFGKSYQYDRFLKWITEKTDGILHAPKISPKTARLYKKDGRFEAHVNFEITCEAKEALTWLGVDRGIHNIASLCVIRNSGDIIAEENFSGSALKYVQKKMEKRQKTEQKKGKVYRSTTRLAEANKAVHGIANRIVTLAEKHHSQVVMEHLGNLTARNSKRGRSNFNRLLGRQQYTKLKDVIVYKLRRAGLPDPLFISPAYTSSTCPKCGDSNKTNRNREDAKNRFHCQSCGYQHDADLNAARIIALKKIWRKGLPKTKKTNTVEFLENTDSSFSSFLKRLDL